MELSIERGLKWSEIGRELGRSAIQCHTWYMSRDPKVNNRSPRPYSLLYITNPYPDPNPTCITVHGLAMLRLPD